MNLLVLYIQRLDYILHRVGSDHALFSFKRLASPVSRTQELNRVITFEKSFRLFAASTAFSLLALNPSAKLSIHLLLLGRNSGA